MKRKEVWITRDEKDHPDSDRLFLHVLKPRWERGQWNPPSGGFDVPDTEATAIPDVAHGKIKMLRIPVHE